MQYVQAWSFSNQEQGWSKSELREGNRSLLVIAGEPDPDLEAWGVGVQEQALIRWRGESGNSGAHVVLPDATGIHTETDRAQTKCRRRERLGATKTGRC